MFIMRKSFIRNLAVITKPRFETLFYQTLQDVLEISANKNDEHLPNRVVNKMIECNLDCDNLYIKEDLSLTDAEINSWITKLAARLRSEDIAIEFSKELQTKEDATIAEILASFISVYAYTLQEKGVRIIYNTALGFKKVNIKEAIRRRGEVPPPSDAYSSKLLVLNAEYFHYENFKPISTSFTEFRKEFLRQYFHILNTYCEDVIKQEEFNSIFKDFI